MNDVDDSQERIDAFQRRISEDSGGNCIIIPVIHLLAKKGYDGNARHLIHDCQGYVIRENPTPYGSQMTTVIPPSSLELFKRIAREQDYISKAGIQRTSTDVEVIKD
jgi:hypothetical protein